MNLQPSKNEAYPSLIDTLMSLLSDFLSYKGVPDHEQDAQKLRGDLIAVLQRDLTKVEYIKALRASCVVYGPPRLIVLPDLLNDDHREFFASRYRHFYESNQTLGLFDAKQWADLVEANMEGGMRRSL